MGSCRSGSSRRGRAGQLAPDPVRREKGHTGSRPGARVRRPQARNARARGSRVGADSPTASESAGAPDAHPQTSSLRTAGGDTCFLPPVPGPGGATLPLLLQPHSLGWVVTHAVREPQDVLCVGETPIPGPGCLHVTSPRGGALPEGPAGSGRHSTASQVRGRVWGEAPAGGSEFDRAPQDGDPSATHFPSKTPTQHPDRHRPDGCC